MKEEISKELLSEVLGLNDIHLILYDEDTKEVNYTRYANFTRGSRDEYINIHELQHKCKEWATEKGYEIVETTFMIRIKRVGQDKQKIWEYPREMQDAGIYFSPSFTFKACQWILNNRNTTNGEEDE